MIGSRELLLLLQCECVWNFVIEREYIDTEVVELQIYKLLRKNVNRISQAEVQAKCNSLQCLD